MSEKERMNCVCCNGGLGLVFRYDEDLGGYTCRSCAHSIDVAETVLAKYGIIKCTKRKDEKRKKPGEEGN